MKRWFQKAAVVLLVACAAIIYALVEYHPAFPQTAAGWAALVCFGVPLLILADAYGEWLRGLHFYRTWPSPFRVLFGVVAICAFLILLAGPVALVSMLIRS